MLKESVEECRRIMRSRSFHVKIDGSVAHSLNTDTVGVLIGNLLTNVKQTQ